MVASGRAVSTSTCLAPLCASQKRSYKLLYLALMLERLFEVHERGSTVRAELLGGATTFVTMA